MDDLEILDLEEGSGETGEVSNLCLVGKVLSPKIINNIAVTNVCTTAWKDQIPFLSDTLGQQCVFVSFQRSRG